MSILSPVGTDGVGGGGVGWDAFWGLEASFTGSDLLSAGLVVSAGLEVSAGLGASFVWAGEDEDPEGLGRSASTPKSGFPTATVCPAFAKNLVMTPWVGLLISTVTLSVSTLATV